MNVNVKEKMNKAIKLGGTIIGYAIVGLVTSKIIDNYQSDYDSDIRFDSQSTVKNYCYGYSDTVKAITQSSMGSFYKNEMIGKVKKNQTLPYYNSVIAIANATNMSDYYKCDSLDKLNKD